MSYGILRVTWDNGFDRTWVRGPEGTLLCDNQNQASELAEAMTEAAREEDILGVGYRARRYDENA